MSNANNQNTAMHNKHYTDMPIEPIEVMAMLLTKEEFKGFLKGNIIKYTYRAGRKPGEDTQKDLDKAKVYSDWLESLK